jgi:alpha-N-acetylglucosamine transferase
MKAYVTYLTSDNYFLGVLTLWESIKATKTEYPFYCMVNQKVSLDIVNHLRDMGVKIIQSPIIKLPQNLLDYNKKFCYSNEEVLENYFQKFLVFALDKFEKIVYLDSDMILLKNVDELFDKPHMAGAVDHIEEEGHMIINGGLIVIKPSKAIYDDFINFIKNSKEQELYDNANKHHRCFWDTDFYGARFKDWATSDPNQIVDIRYNVFITAFQNYEHVYHDEVKNVHLTGKKPWLMTLEELYLEVKNNYADASVFYQNYIEFYLKAIKNLADMQFNQKNDLCNLMEKYGSDKNSIKHNYTKFYYKVLKNFRRDDIRLFELGIGSINPNIGSNMGQNGNPGASLFAWSEFLPNAEIFGADIDKDILINTDQIKTFWCDSLNSKAIQAMWSNKLLEEPLHIIIDDGLHSFESNKNFFENSIHKLHKDGFYFIEDIDSSDIWRFKEQITQWEKQYPTMSFTFINLHEDGIYNFMKNTYNYHDNVLLMIRYKDLEK